MVAQLMVKIVVNDASVTSYKCEMLFDGNILSYGTCFFYKCGGRSFIISNWHNFAGRDPTTLKPLSKYAAIPDEVNVMLPLKGNLGSSMWERFRLVDVEDRALWIEHPLRSRVDVVALEVQVSENCEPRYVNELKHDPYLELAVAGDLFIVGYPRGLSVAETLPLWKRASLASEPGIDVDQLPKYLVDTATREGMSGSPVFARGNYIKGSFTTTGNPHEDNRPWTVAYTYNFVGIYSGRIGENSFLAQLGIVWKARVIEEIIEV